MGALAREPKIARRQLKSRIQFASGIFVIALGVSAVFTFMSVVRNANCTNCNKSNLRVRRETEEEPVEPDAYASDKFQPKFNETDENKEILSSWSKKFYDHHYKLYFRAEKKNTTTLDKYDFADDQEAAKTCNTELQALYSKTNGYQLNDIYWCDSTDFFTDAFNVQQRSQGFVILHILGMIYMFLALALVCDEYFVPALEALSEKLDLSPDVAGATFMAAGGSAPELFTAVIGVFVADSNVGIGTIVGSAVFNILFVLGACALIVGMKPDEDGNPTILNLTWFPLTRDCIFYIISLVVLIVAFGGDQIEWWESLLLFLIYVSYVTFMMFNEKIETALAGKKPTEDTEMSQVNHNTANLWRSAAKAVKTRQQEWHTNIIALMAQKHNDDYNDSLANYAVKRFYALKCTNAKSQISDGEEGKPLKDNNETNEDQEKIDNEYSLGSPYALDWPAKGDSCFSGLMKIVCIPLLIPLKFTIPDVKYDKIKNLCNGYIFIISFFMSIIWISVFSFLMVWWATRIGETWNIDSALMGLTVLAAGTSVPDLLTSVIVAREGHGDMAVSSSIGSNIFDVTVGLPLPWLLWSFVNGMKAKSVSSEGLVCSIGMLLLMLVVLVGSILATGWKMNRVMGFAMLILYVIFVAVSLLLEYGVINCFV